MDRQKTEAVITAPRNSRGGMSKKANAAAWRRKAKKRKARRELRRKQEAEKQARRKAWAAEVAHVRAIAPYTKAFMAIEPGQPIPPDLLRVLNAFNKNHMPDGR